MININQNRMKSLTTQWPKEKWQRTNNNLQNTAQKTKYWAIRKPLKNRSELRCSTRVSKSCYASGTRRVTLVTNTVISHELGKDREVLTTSVLLKPHQSGRFGALKSDSTHHFFRIFLCYHLRVNFCLSNRYIKTNYSNIIISYFIFLNGFLWKTICQTFQLNW